MKKYSILIFLIFNFINLFSQENFIQINGKTNINTFKCINSKFSDTIYNFSGEWLPNINLRVSDFNCGNKMMNRDFYNTLSADSFPNMTIKFLKFSKNKDQYNAEVEVKLMNQTKKYNIDLIAEDNKLIGKRTIKFSEFKIKTPQKFGGMIYVKDDLNLIFSLSSKYQ